MKNKTKRILTLALLLLTILSLAAVSSCGKDDEKAGTKEIKNGQVELPADGNVVP